MRRTWNRLLGSLSRTRKQDAHLSEDFETHIQLMVEEYIRRGTPKDEAYRRAKLQFGSIEATKENYRDQRGLPVLDILVKDVRYAFRGMRRSPGFATVAILSLGIGIAANIAIFSLVNAVLLRPLAYKDPHRVLAVGQLVNPMQAREWEKACPSLEHIALMQANGNQIAAGGEPAFIPGAFITHNLFTLFGVEPILGRLFLEEEEQDGNDRCAARS